MLLDLLRFVSGSAIFLMAIYYTPFTAEGSVWSLFRKDPKDFWKVFLETYALVADEESDRDNLVNLFGSAFVTTLALVTPMYYMGSAFETTLVDNLLIFVLGVLCTYASLDFYRTRSGMMRALQLGVAKGVSQGMALYFLFSLIFLLFLG